MCVLFFTHTHPPSPRLTPSLPLSLFLSLSLSSTTSLS